MKFISLVCLVFVLACANAVDNERETPELAAIYNKCESIKERRVMIDVAKAKSDKTLEPFNFLNFDQVVNWDYKNLDTPSFTLNEGVNVSLTISGSNLSEPYQLWKLRLVNQNEYQGSKHYIDNVNYPFELHVVCVNKQLKSLFIAVFLLKEDQKENVALKELLEAVLKNKTGFQWKLSTILPPIAELEDYYRYDGKSSNASCTDEIKWAIFEKPITISAEQLKVLVSQVVPKTNRVFESVSLTEVYSTRIERRVIKEEIRFEIKGMEPEKTDKKKESKQAEIPGNSANSIMNTAFSSLIAALGLNLFFL